MATRDATDEIRWEEMLDGELHRLTRGRDYTALSEAVEDQAKAAAEELGKWAITWRDQMGKREYLWVQFFDGKLRVGQACTTCGNHALQKVQEYFGRCPACGSLFALSERPLDDSDQRAAEVAEYLGLRLVAGDDSSQTLDEVNLLDDFVVEARYRFAQPVPSVTPQFWFQRGTKRFLRATAPHAYRVPKPGVVRFVLHVGANVLLSGDYSVGVSARFRLEEDDEDSVKVDTPDDQLHDFHVFDPREEPGHDGRTHLHWRVTGTEEDEPLEAILEPTVEPDDER